MHNPTQALIQQLEATPSPDYGKLMENFVTGLIAVEQLRFHGRDVLTNPATYEAKGTPL